MYKIEKSERGQAIVLLALSLVALVGFVALAIDGGMAFSDRRNAQSVSDAASLAGGGFAALALENYGVFWSNFDCSSSSLNTIRADAVTTAKISAVTKNGYPLEDVVVTTLCEDNGSGADPKYIDLTTTISKTTQPALIHIVYNGQVVNLVDSTVRIHPRHPLVFGNAIVALNDLDCSGQSNGIGFHGGANVEVIGGGVFSNGCMRGDGGTTVDVTGGNISYFHEQDNQDWSSFSPNPDQLSGDENKIPSSAYDVEYPDCTHPDANNVSASYIEGNTLAPGLYCITGDVKINNDNESVYGTGVTLYFLDGEFVMNGGVVQITAPTSDSNPAITNMLILFAPGNNSKILINGNADSIFQGTILAPESNIDMLGGGNTDGFRSQMIGWNVEVGGTADTFVHYDDNNNYSKPSSIDLYE